MKKVLIIFLSFIIAFGINELFVRYVIGYPTKGVKKQLLGIGADFSGSEYIAIPYSKYWNVEGGNITEERNNYGLPGCDIWINDSTKLIYLLGNSFTAALQVRKDKMATTIFQNNLNNNFDNHCVVNLGADAHDIYGLFFRLKYFERDLGKPYKVFLIIAGDELDVKWMKDRYDTLDFVKSKNFGKENKNIKLLISNYLRNKFSSINLMRYLFSENKREEKDEIKDINKKQNIVEKDFELFEKVLLGYKNEYEKKFVLVSITDKKYLNEYLARTCQKNGIQFYQKTILKQANILTAHLNERGNLELGLFLYEIFTKEKASN